MCDRTGADGVLGTKSTSGCTHVHSTAITITDRHNRTKNLLSQHHYNPPPLTTPKPTPHPTRLILPQSFRDCKYPKSTLQDNAAASHTLSGKSFFSEQRRPFTAGSQGLRGVRPFQDTAHFKALYARHSAVARGKIYTQVRRVTALHSSGAVSRWPSWAVRPNEPSGFRGRKAILNHASALVTACP